MEEVDTFDGVADGGVYVVVEEETVTPGVEGLEIVRDIWSTVEYHLLYSICIRKTINQISHLEFIIRKEMK